MRVTVCCCARLLHAQCAGTTPSHRMLLRKPSSQCKRTQHIQHACRDVLVMVMRKHQRYFPVFAPGGGALLPAFITVANGPVDVAAVAAGNEAVLRARFEDAAFFYREDLQTPLAEFRCGESVLLLSAGVCCVCVRER